MSDSMEVIDLTLDDSEMDYEWTTDFKDRAENDSPPLIATHQDECVFILDQSDEDHTKVVEDWVYECILNEIQ